MPHIQVSEDQFRRLSVAALAAGFQDVSAFIAYFADEPTDDPRGSLDDPMIYDVVISSEAKQALDDHIEFITVEKCEPLNAERWLKKADLA